MNKKNILVGQSGGPTAAINSSLYGVVSEALKHTEEIDRGYQREPLRCYLRRCAPQRYGWLRLRYDKWNRGLSRGFLYEPFRNTLR